MKNLKVTLIQTDIIWENCEENLAKYENQYLSKLKKGETDLILFPELFTTGFSMKTELFYETMQGQTIQWMTKWALKLNTYIGGSVIIKENNNYYNRFLMVSKNGVETFYDKKHLFRMGNEHQHFSAGNKSAIFKIKGWKIRLQVCYDLRFPVFSRNKVIDNQKEYDALIYVANWPAVRSSIWSVLLNARAIENQAYCIGVNRVGLDGNQIQHTGNSTMVTPWGKVFELNTNIEQMQTVVLLKNELDTISTKFPAFLDADAFHLTDK